ncbi:MAG: DUF302 domain-containing protein [Alphaproteobacteria bacterium]|nr:DUF302 domain-containing protein [Alphaproteobacteria bacterium]
MRHLALALSLVIAAGFNAQAGENQTTDIPTKYTFSVLVKRLDAAIKKHKMFVVTRASASIGAKRRGVSIPGNMVIGVYRNDFAVRMLAASVPAGIEAPIRFYIWQAKDGKAVLSYRKPSVVFAPYKGGVKLTTLAGQLDVIFAAIAKDAVK